MRALAWTVLLFVAVGAAGVGCSSGRSDNKDAASVSGSKSGKAGADRKADMMKDKGGGREAAAREAAKDNAAAGGNQGAPQAGQLTAGSCDDNLHLSWFHRFLRKLSQDGSVAGLPARFEGR